MVPLSLSIEGLYSYQQRQEIDFRKLTEAQLFGIFGATGSGKSSILEAITFALYGQSDRLNQRDNRGYNMMNLRSDKLQIEFRFETEEEEYLFAVSGKRNSRRFEEVKTIERKAYRVEKGALVPLAEANAETILGLSYENFRRTVIVPQGKFQEFLQLTETERTRMMREIFRLERFELYRKTLVLEHRVKSEIDKTQSLIAKYAAVSPEIIAEMESKVQKTRGQLEVLEDELKQQEKKFQQQQALQQLFQETEEQTQKLKELEAQLPERKQREKQLKAYEQCLLQFKPLLDRKGELVRDQRDIETQLQQKTASKVQVVHELERKEVHFEKVSQEYQSRDQWTYRAEELRKVIQLKNLEKTVLALSRRLADGKEKIRELQEEVREHKQILQERELELKKMQEQRPDLRALMPVRDWYQQMEQLEKSLDEAEKDAMGSQSRKDALDRSKQETLGEVSVSNAQFSLPTSRLIELLQHRWEEEKEQVSNYKEGYESALAHKHLEEIVEQLEEGKACPLCGATHHPQPLMSEENSAQLASFKQKIEEGEQEILLLQRTIAKLEGVRTQEEQVVREWEARQRQTQALRSEIEQKRTAFTWGDHMSKQYVEEQIAKIDQTDNLIRELNLQREAIVATIGQHEKTLEKWRNALEQIGKDHQQQEISFLSGKKSLKYISYEARKIDPDASIEELALEYDQNYKRMEESFKSVETQIRQLRSRRDSLSGECKGLEDQKKQLQTQLAQKNLELDQVLKHSEFEHLKEVDELLLLNLDIDTEKRLLREFEQSLHATRTALSSLQMKTKDKEFSLEAFEQIRVAIEEKKKEKSELMIELGSMQKELERLQEDLAFRQQQEELLARHQLRADNLLVLKRMFHKSGFVNYVSTMYLQHLCAAANDRFMKLTRGALSLETTESNSFLVRDYLNNGQIRSVKTLSGGQTFQAALSLALALADQVQQQAKSRQNFFFLDEGFGSQDKHALQIIFQTLKSLRQENRIVGIISHVEELQQEISAFLLIQNDPEKGSQVKGSWE